MPYSTLERMVNLDLLRAALKRDGLHISIHRWFETAAELERSKWEDLHALRRIYMDIQESDLSVEQVFLCFDTLLSKLSPDSAARLLAVEAPDARL